jgi:hypothetical protein
MLKHNPGTVLTLLLISCSAHAASAEYLTPDPNAKEINPAEISKKLDSIYLRPIERPDIYAGYLIGANNINYPAIQQTGSTNITWRFPAEPSSFFSFNSNLLVNDYEGRVYQLNGNTWTLMDITLKPRSHVLKAEQDIIACTKFTPTKAAPGQPICYAVKAGWLLPYSTQVKPALCGDKLRIATQKRKMLEISEIDLASGKQLRSTLKKKIIGSICAVPIN